MSNLQVEANQSTNNIPITLTPKQQPTLLLTPDKVWGTKDYKDLENKPSLNGRELTKGMTLADFNLHPDKVEKNEEDIININEYLKELTPKNTAEGESSLYIKDALELPIFEMSIDGNSYQQQTTGKQLYNYKDTTQVSDGITVDEEGWITATYDNTDGTATKFLNYWTNNLNLKADTDYLVVMEIKSVTGTGAIKPASTNFTNSVQNQGQFKEDNIYRHFSKSSNNTVDIISRTTVSNPMDMTNGIRSYIYFVAGDSGSITFRLSVLEDTSITPETFVYEKYTGENPSPNPLYSSPIQIIQKDVSYRVFNKNLLPISNTISKQGTTINGVTFILNEDGTILANGTATNAISVYLHTEYTTFTKGVYTFSDSVLEGESSSTYFLYADVKHIDRSNWDSANFTTSHSTAGMTINFTEPFMLKTRIVIRNGQTLNNVLFKPMLEKNSKATEYKTSNHNITSIDLKGNFIGKLSNKIADRLLYKNKHIYLEKNIKKRVLNGTESWGTEFTTYYIGNFNGRPYEEFTIENPYALCNHFKWRGGNTNNFQYGSFWYSLNGKLLRFQKDENLDLASWKTWLSKNNLELYYATSEPELIDLGEYNLFTFAGENYIDLLANLEASLIETTYALDLKKYYDNKIAELSNQLL